MSSTIGVYVRLDAARVAKLDSIVSGAGVPTSRAGVAAQLLGVAIDGAEVRREQTPGEKFAAFCQRAGVDPAEVLASLRPAPARVTVEGDGAAPAHPETPPERLDRLRAAVGLSQRSLCEQLGISYGKLQRARADGKVPPEVEAWMRQQEGGGR